MQMYKYPNSSFDFDRLSLEEVQARQWELTSSLSETKAEMREILGRFDINADGDTEIIKTHEELTKENEQLKKTCAILHSRLKDTISELEEAKVTIDGLRSGYNSSRGGMHRSDRYTPRASKDIKSSQAEIEELSASNDQLSLRLMDAKDRLRKDNFPI
ncbi:hypothetical protein I203_106900 [Kwoniella mangroviensis CBS 8507]|uniref:hypothetical protein n=1 Tax=Kwoniella mangroviensis CBS 8507 TaxID=1296122 RepID=UPI00080D16BF|nr:uncharacterized protein I203_08389 [Kwoniella mangroviensis CBS 8507]OCF62535.1 hypothetical protein I203_08389 [Kwoniella mangroviensis CBS 8507]